MAQYTNHENILSPIVDTFPNAIVKKFQGNICIRQRIPASYRFPFFDLLAERCDGEVFVLAGQPQEGEGISTKGCLQQAQLIEVENTYRSSGVFLSYSQRKLIETLTDLRPSVLVTEANPRFSDLGKTVRFAHQLDIPIVGWGIGTTDFWNMPFKRLRAWFRNYKITQLDGMLCYGSKAASQYEEIGFPKERLFVLYNATVRRPANPDPPTRNTSPSVVKFISIGRLIESKGVDRLIEASAIASQNGTKHEVLVVGDGPFENKLKVLAEQRAAPVSFLGRKSGEELADIARTSDVFVLPGLGGLAIQEAMAFGLPVIVTEADGTELDLVKDNGWIIEKENVQALADCMRDVAANKTDLERRGQESYRIVREEINLDLMADRFIFGLKQMATLGIR